MIYLGGIYLMVLWRGACDYMQDWADRRSIILISGCVESEKLCQEVEDIIKEGKVE